MDRKLIRPQLRGETARSGGGAARRPVAESTLAEAGYLQLAVESKASFVVQLLGGDEIRGRLEAHDRDVLIVALDGKPPVVVRKDRVRAYWMERSSA